uniref:C3H1-type domain-containing protein n=1 Tax=Chromera velia CCMP2878 TaxID=1169474 RepID=A0A0G4G6M0_9ALVE|eukprot:Cvel_20481.t1-p1 / transcript=Cvel_20481.t1 / gene=Cvel_20481 / organism=Chromera_velia_CCMP2878 / gene_product=hypothetical protein / transcript_product=hypothetical protein / location=Cvel_scaffold1841:5605-8302(-) / protein_length=645 / sequence_SO=supercontig / SO=protein_coding / is_pseudo=false
MIVQVLDPVVLWAVAMCSEQNISGNLEVKDGKVDFGKVRIVKANGIVSLLLSTWTGTSSASMLFDPATCHVLYDDPHLTLVFEDLVSLTFKVSLCGFMRDSKVSQKCWTFTFDNQNPNERKKSIDWFLSRAGLSKAGQQAKKSQGRGQTGPVTEAYRFAFESLKGTAAFGCGTHPFAKNPFAVAPFAKNPFAVASQPGHRIPSRPCVLIVGVFDCVEECSFTERIRRRVTQKTGDRVKVETMNFDRQRLIHRLLSGRFSCCVIVGLGQTGSDDEDRKVYQEDLRRVVCPWVRSGGVLLFAFEGGNEILNWLGLPWKVVSVSHASVEKNSECKYIPSKILAALPSTDWPKTAIFSGVAEEHRVYRVVKGDLERKGMFLEGGGDSHCTSAAAPVGNGLVGAFGYTNTQDEPIKAIVGLALAHPPYSPSASSYAHPVNESDKARAGNLTEGEGQSRKRGRGESSLEGEERWMGVSERELEEREGKRRGICSRCLRETSVSGYPSSAWMRSEGGMLEREGYRWEEEWAKEKEEEALRLAEGMRQREEERKRIQKEFGEARAKELARCRALRQGYVGVSSTFRLPTGVCTNRSIHTQDFCTYAHPEDQESEDALPPHCRHLAVSGACPFGGWCLFNHLPPRFKKEVADLP